MTEKDLISTAVAMQEMAYAPYSNFPVGAALLCEDGTVYTGCNVENASYGCTVCAERTALLKAVSEGHRSDWRTIAIAGSGPDYCWPCGICRQMLYEFAPDLRILAVRGDGAVAEATLSQLLPNGFGGEQLERNEERDIASL
ncbi:MAG: cytidine deaminase [Lawsonibacter sp.]|jgi:cytidine deaminase